MEGEGHAKIDTNVYERIQAGSRPTPAIEPKIAGANRSRSGNCEQYAQPLHWCKQCVEQGEQAFPGSGHLPSLKEENRQPKREVDILCQERDLKKSHRHLLTTADLTYQFIADDR